MDTEIIIKFPPTREGFAYARAQLDAYEPRFLGKSASIDTPPSEPAESDGGSAQRVAAFVSGPRLGFADLHARVTRGSEAFLRMLVVAARMSRANERGFTMEALAEALNVKTGTIHNYRLMLSGRAEHHGVCATLFQTQGRGRWKLSATVAGWILDDRAEAVAS